MHNPDEVSELETRFAELSEEDASDVVSSLVTSCVLQRDVDLLDMQDERITQKLIDKYGVFDDLRMLLAVTAIEHRSSALAKLFGEDV